MVSMDLQVLLVSALLDLGFNLDLLVPVVLTPPQDRAVMSPVDMHFLDVLVLLVDLDWQVLSLLK